MVKAKETHTKLNLEAQLVMRYFSRNNSGKPRKISFWMVPDSRAIL